MFLTAHGATDVGRKRRRNEDAFLVDNELGLYAVADGMGGHSAGDVASQRAIDVVRDAIAARTDAFAQLADDPSLDNRLAAERVVQQAIQAACAEIHRAAQSDPKLGGMGTTFVCLAVAGDRGLIGHVGDSRLILVRGGETFRLTEDHTLVAGMIKSGEITAEQVQQSPLRNILTRALGQQASVEVDTLTIELLPGDTFLLCSDGLHGYLADDEIAPLFAASEASALPAELIGLANERGGKDNITAIVLQVPPEHPAEPEALTRINALRGVPLFEHLSYREQAAVVAIAGTRSYPAGGTIVIEGEPGGDLFVVLRGRVSIERGGVAIASVLAGGHFGEMGLVDAGPRSATVRAMAPTRAMVIAREDMLALMHQDAPLAVKLLWTFVQSLSQRLRAANSDLSEAILAGAVDAMPFSGE